MFFVFKLCDFAMEPDFLEPDHLRLRGPVYANTCPLKTPRTTMVTLKQILTVTLDWKVILVTEALSKINFLRQ